MRYDSSKMLKRELWGSRKIINKFFRWKWLEYQKKTIKPETRVYRSHVGYLGPSQRPLCWDVAFYGFNSLFDGRHNPNECFRVELVPLPVLSTPQFTRPSTPNCGDSGAWGLNDSQFGAVASLRAIRMMNHITWSTELYLDRFISQFKFRYSTSLWCVFSFKIMSCT